MANYYCKYCGSKHTSVSSLTASYCSKNPSGKNHALYEGSEKSQYTCKYCGSKHSTLSSLTASYCSKNPDGKNHAPAL